MKIRNCQVFSFNFSGACGMGARLLLVVFTLFSLRSQALVVERSPESPQIQTLQNYSPGVLEAYDFSLDEYRPTDFSRYPWVGLVYSDHVPIKCSGVLIAPNVVLTAGHCFAPRGVQTFSNLPIYFALQSRGSTRSYKEKRKAQLARIGRYRDPAMNDWAVLVLNEPIESVHEFPSRYVYANHGEAKTGESISIAGYPKSVESNVSAMMTDRCTLDLPPAPIMHDHYYSSCGGRGGLSGGPVFIDEHGETVLIGIVVAVVKVAGEQGILIQSFLTNYDKIDPFVRHNWEGSLNSYVRWLSSHPQY